MKVLIMGGSGMLGHKLWQKFSNRFDAYVTLRSQYDKYRQYNIFDENKTVCNIRADDFRSIAEAMDQIRPDIVINCIGIVKQTEAARDPLTSIAINALFPHRLAQLCRPMGIRVIQISTDCVYSGMKGDYKEEDISDARDLYGRTKFLGELGYAGCLTLRTSIIGRELETTNGLVEWFLSQEGRTIEGYTKAIFSGLTTECISDVIGMAIEKYPEMHGVWHVASEPISKYDLLSLIGRIYQLDVNIEKNSTIVIDRSLNSDRFTSVTGFQAPDWHDMIEQMYLDTTPYRAIRRLNAER